MTTGLMIGAVGSHLGPLGIEVNNDGGLLFGIALVALVSGATVAWIRRRELPLVGAWFRSYGGGVMASRFLALLCLEVILFGCTNRTPPEPAFARFDHLHGSSGIEGIADLQKSLARGEDLLALLLPHAATPCRVSVQGRWNYGLDYGEPDWVKASIDGIVLDGQNYASLYVSEEVPEEIIFDRQEVISHEGILWSISYDSDFGSIAGAVEPWNISGRPEKNGPTYEGVILAPSNEMHPIAQILDYAKDCHAVLEWDLSENRAFVILHLKLREQKEEASATAVKLAFSMTDGTPLWVKWFQEELVAEFRIERFELLERIDLALFHFEPPERFVMIYDGRVEEK